MEKINIAEILADCPKGTKLYSPIFGEVYLDKIRPHLAIIVTTDKYKEEFLYDGRYGMNGECMLFPSKDQRDWSKFQQPFKDGDILISGLGGCDDNPFIFKQTNRFSNAECYCAINCRGKLILNNDNWTPIKGCRFATEEEKQKLFYAIKSNDYKWNEETKTLEKLVKPKFKVGDKIVKKNSVCVPLVITGVSDDYYSCNTENSIKVLPVADQDDWGLVKDNIEPKFKVGDIVQNKNTNMIGTITLIDYADCDYTVSLKNGGITYILFEFQDEWELVKDNIEPKFKVGDKIKYKNGKNIDGVEQGVILSITDEVYDVAVTNNMGVYVSIAEQDNWELVPNKFDITTLKPFDKVLVRDNVDEIWFPNFFGGLNKDNEDYPYMVIGCESWKCCIPYEGKKHLLNTNKECDEYYKNW